MKIDDKQLSTISAAINRAVYLVCCHTGSIEFQGEPKPDDEEFGELISTLEDARLEIEEIIKTKGSTR